MGSWTLYEVANPMTIGTARPLLIKHERREDSVERRKRAYLGHALGALRSLMGAAVDLVFGGWHPNVDSQPVTIHFGFPMTTVTAELDTLEGAGVAKGECLEVVAHTSEPRLAQTRQPRLAARKDRHRQNRPVWLRIERRYELHNAEESADVHVL